MQLYKQRNTALRHGINKYQGKPCRNGHPGVRYTNCNRCVMCMSKRYQRLLAATPSWITASERQEIRALFALAETISQKQSVQHSVDHYYPLFGNTVCGLHTINNLRIITHKENMKKKNKHPDTFYNNP